MSGSGAGFLAGLILRAWRLLDHVVAPRPVCRECGRKARFTYYGKESSRGRTP